MTLAQLKWPILLGLMSSLLLALLLNWLAGIEPKKNARTAVNREQWHMISIPALDASAAVAELAQHNFWGLPVKSVLAASEPMTAPNWRIMAVVQRGGVSRVIVVFEDQLNNPIELKIGDKLPGGTAIVDIKPEFVMVRIGGKVRALSTMR